jgi:hypothetical protein
MKKRSPRITRINTNYFDFSFVFFVCFVDHFHGSYPYTISSTTPYLRNERKKFVITNPLHPLHGKEFEAINYRPGSKISGVFFHDSNGHSQLVPVEWTDIVPVDPYIIISGGRSLFRYEDLVSLAQLMKNIDYELR